MTAKPDKTNTLTAHPELRKILHIIVKICKIVLPMAISALLVVWLFRKVNFHEIKEVISQGVRFEFIAAMMFLTMLSFIIRGLRWGYQLDAAGVPHMSPVGRCVSIFGAYALNLVVQFIGEAWRCVFVAHRQKVKLATIVGTDLGDRGSDGVMIAMIIAVTFALASTQIEHFFNQFPLGRFLEKLFDHWELYAGALLLLAILILADWKWRNTKFFSGVNLSIKRIWDGFRVLFYMKGRWPYLWLTLAIWVCYFLETYLCFYAFPFTREITAIPGSGHGLIPGLVVFVFGAASMLVPSNGGLGPWNVAVMYALMLYGVSRTDAVAYSLVVWGFQSVMIIALGIFSAIYVITTKGDNDTKPTADTDGASGPEPQPKSTPAQN